MNVISIDLDRIDDSDRLRPVDIAWAKVIAASMAEQGQMQPIEVLPPGEDGKYKLVFGAHRVAARRLNGETAVDAVLFEGSLAEARLREIDENLANADLNDLDRAIFLGERKRLYEELHPQTRHGKGRQKGQVADSATILRFTLETARLMKKSERTIQQLVHRYDNLVPSVRARIRGTWLASVGKELDAIARLKPEEQAKVVEMLLRDKDPEQTVSAALAKSRGVVPRPVDDADAQFSKLVLLWGKTGRDARERFRAFVAREKSNEARATQAALKAEMRAAQGAE